MLCSLASARAGDGYFKTARTRLGPLRDRIAGLHPYDVPEFLVLPIAGGSEEYLEWLKGSVDSNQTHGPQDPRT